MFCSTHDIEVDGAVLAVEFVRCDRASAAPVVFLHAGVADSRMWDAQQAALRTQRSTLRYDRRGFGITKVRRPVTHSLVGDLCAVLDAVGVERADFVGCSQGGRIALDLALAAPDRVASLLLVAPAVTGAPALVPEESTGSLASAIEAAEVSADLDRVNELEAQLWLDGPAGPVGRVGGSARELFLDMNGKALRSPITGDAVEAHSAWHRLEDVRCPSCVLWGDLDLPHLQSRCEVIVERIRQARRVVFPGAAHLPPLEAPDRFNAALQAFLLDLQVRAACPGFIPDT
jgi:pimeloyl-ACP methyl ester carboxylesterase